ncbi:pimeloyl-ACP methyl ester carboxylesterase [Actinokineospora baliensis]|uniref:alpha/beta fold hydrolase n=1 Tax=Actinokineospora baliensis TaxID=547056 RepID=UPI0027DB3517|nr:alpha/beta fold hydrolase [Actinokineospora baliensis]MBM7775023.1 pimeloyl-ACP methyl ester carboxylesterase [Actinokineospora baliensis]
MKRFGALVAAATMGVGVLAGSAAATSTESTADTLALYHKQRLTWKPCDHEVLDKAGAQCADVTVPMDYSRPRGRTITVAISRLKATDAKQRRGVMLSNPGGPGGQGLDMMVGVRERMSADVRARYDLIGMDPRGIGRSTPVDCGWPIGNMLRSGGENWAAFEANTALLADLARRRCSATEGEYLRHTTTRNTARDMDVVRGALGEPRISYFGWSYGTYLGAVYTQMFPGRSDRFVLDSAINPRDYGLPMMQAMGEVNEAALDDWARWTAARDAQYHLGTTPRQVRAAVEDLLRRAAHKPIPLGTTTINQHELPVVLFVHLADVRSNPTLAADVRLLVDAAAGKPVTPSPELLTILRLFQNPTLQTQGSGQAAVLCGDAPMPRDPRTYWRTIQRIRPTQPVFGALTHNISACAFWRAPAEPLTTIHNSTPALIVQATADTRTPYTSGVGLHRALPASRLVTLQDVRIHAIFGHYPNTCVETTINTYLRDGTLPRTNPTCHND